MKWFQHQTDSLRNRKIRKVLRIHGPTGYGIWFALLEKLYEAEGDFQVKADELWLEDFAEDLKITDYRTLVRVFDTFAEVGLISRQLWAEQVIYCEKIVEEGTTRQNPHTYSNGTPISSRVAAEEVSYPKIAANLTVGPPNRVSGLYFLILKGVVVYIGMSVSCIRSRLKTHARYSNMDFDSYTVMSGPEKGLAAAEDAMIQSFKPKYNKTYKGESNAFSIKHLDSLMGV